ncbi:MAG: GntR family transcriptional regulator [Burkholderiaceae bacterium]
MNHDAPVPSADDPSSGEPRHEAPRFAPLYQQVVGFITRGLQSGEWQPGEMIPGEQELAGRYRVSQGTVRKAIDRLVAEHMLVRRQGRGTFVATHQEPRAHFRFLRLRDSQDRVPNFGSRIVGCRRQRAPQDVARMLGLRTGESVIHIERVLDFDGTPTVLDHIWLPGARFRGLTAERVGSHEGPLYALFESEFGTRMLSARERVRAVAATPEQAAALEIAPGAPLLLVERQSHTYEGEVVEFRSGLYRTDTYHYLSEVGR